MAFARKPSAAEWQQHENTIKELYMMENMTLEKVMTKMEDVYGFYATQSQYTTKFAKWGCSKNHKRTFYETIGGKLKKRGLDVDDVTVYINQQIIPTKKLKKEVSRYTKPAWDNTFLIASPQTPKGVFIHINGKYENGGPLWSPALPFFDFLRVVEEIKPQITDVVQVNTPDYSLLSLPGHAVNQSGPSTVWAKNTWPSNLFPEIPIDIPNLRGEVDPNCHQGETLRPFADNSDSRALVTGWFNLKLASDPAKQQEQVFSYIEPLTIDKVPGDTASAVRTLLGPPSAAKIPVLLAYMAYLVSNALIYDSDVDKFVQWILSQSNSRTLLTIVAKISTSASLTARPFATQLFHSAMRLNKYGLAHFFVQCGIDIEQPSNGWDSLRPLERALEQEAVETVVLLVSKGADVNAGILHQCVNHDLSDYGNADESTNKCTELPIIIASQNLRTLKLLPMLLEWGATLPRDCIIRDVVITLGKRFEVHDVDGIELLKHLIHAGANVNGIGAKSRWLWSYPTALQMAVASSQTEIVRFLLDHGAHPDGPVRPSLRRLISDCASNHPCEYLSPLSIAAGSLNEDSLEILDSLLRAGADVNISAAEIIGTDDFVEEDYPEHYSCGSTVVFTALQAAVDSGDIIKAERLLHKGAQIDTEYGTTPLAIAAYNGDVPMLRLLLDHGADVNACPDQSNGLTALTAAAYNGDTDTLLILLQAGACVEHVPRDHKGARTALQAAAESGNTKALQILLAAVANVNACCASRGGLTALQAAVRSGKRENVTLLLNHGAHVNACCTAVSDGITALDAAIENRDVDSVRLLLSLGARVVQSPRSRTQASCIELAAMSGCKEIVKHLLEAGAAVNRQDNPLNRATALQLAAKAGHRDIVQMLVTAGAHIDAPPYSYHKTALGSAIATQDLDMVCLFIHSGADVQMDIDCRGTSPLSAACAWNAREDIVTSLLSAGADVDYGGNECCDTPLMDAIKLSKSNVAELLITHGADINLRPSPSASTPLQICLKDNKHDFARELIDRGADVNAPAASSCRGRTALQAAAEQGSLQMVSYLLSKDAEVNAPAGPVGGVTALQAVAIKGYLRLAQVLLLRGADVGASASPEDGRTAINGAAEHGRLDMLKYLLDNYDGDQARFELCEGALKHAKQNNQWHVVRFLDEYSKVDGSSQ